MHLCAKAVCPLLQLLQQPLLLPLLLLLHLVLLQQTHAAQFANGKANPLLQFGAAPSPVAQSKQSKVNVQQQQQQQQQRFTIYDPATGHQLEPMQYLPIVLGNKRKPSKLSVNLVELPQLWYPCTCIEFVCMCCVGLQFGESFNHRICVSLQYNAVQFDIQLRISHNRRNIATFGFSARNPPAYCIPILLPLPLFACLRLYNIELHNGNVQICWALVTNIFMNQVFEFQFDCVRFGANGVQFFKLPVTQFNIIDVVSTEELKLEPEEEVRRNVQLDEDYSGISLEGEGERGNEQQMFVRKGRVRTKVNGA